MLLKFGSIRSLMKDLGSFDPPDGEDKFGDPLKAYLKEVIGCIEFKVI